MTFRSVELSMRMYPLPKNAAMARAINRTPNGAGERDANGLLPCIFLFRFVMRSFNFKSHNADFGSTELPELAVA